MKYSKEEQQEMLDRMGVAAGVFYRLAQKTNVHQFLEVTGFLNELVKMYAGMHARGIDFATAPLEAEPHEMAYVAEKLDCIFGEPLTKPENRAAFLKCLEEKGGWKWGPAKALSKGAQQAQKRSANYEQLSGQAQWDEDKALGILDWDGT